ncbi:MAG: DedA family protein [Actinobacteria bacterium]|nr:DedA family protein [Actinomycetota bacterium]
MLYPLADGAATTGSVWAYLAVFVLVAIGWAGVPAIGGAVIAGASVLASQGHLNFAGVLAASLLGTEAGGLAGYRVGIRWGRALMNHPGPWLDRRQQALAAGEVVYARWGRLAVFFTPVLVSGIVKMKLSQFVVWNFLAGAVYVLSVGPAAYGAGKVSSGQASLGDVGTLLAGIAVGVAAFLLARRYYRRHKARRAAAAGLGGEATPTPAADEES